MGDPRKRRKKYSTPNHPWQKERIDSEKEVNKEYGTRRKKEIWKMNSVLKHFHNGAKKAASLNITEQDKKEFNQLLERGRRLGLLTSEDNTTDAVLNLTFNNIMDRRLQTLVFKRGLARTPKQARQFVVHEHIIVGGKKITSPSYLVSLNEESTLEFDPNSTISSEDHPERFQPEEIVSVNEESSESQETEQVQEKKEMKKKVEKKSIKKAEVKAKNKAEVKEEKTETTETV